jgi:GTP-binding protein
MRAIRALEECDVCILMLDATLGLEAQDLKLFGLAKDRHKGIVFVVNKWDLLEKDTNTARDYEFLIRERIAPFTDVPIIFTSVTEKQRIMKILEESLAVHERRIQKVQTSKLNKMLQQAISSFPPPSHKGKHIKINYVTQLPLYYPAFAFFCNHPKLVKKPYKNYLENQLRKNFDFTGVPIEIYFRQK